MPFQKILKSEKFKKKENNLKTEKERKIEKVFLFFFNFSAFLNNSFEITFFDTYDNAPLFFTGSISCVSSVGA